LSQTQPSAVGRPNSPDRFQVLRCTGRPVRSTCRDAHPSYPAPGQIILYPGGVSETEILLAYGGVRFASKVGQLAGNHFITLTSGLDNLYPLGRKTLWEGAQKVRFELE
jgi:hypothetical protein